ncbi:MAG: hypothetical protein O7F71_09340 [Gammaproteobacteria bacterium]|nr:hypothetical protein [Gammaproteobacteria bacterium]
MLNLISIKVNTTLSIIRFIKLQQVFLDLLLDVRLISFKLFASQHLIFTGRRLEFTTVNGN